jgi:hypothetical protein
MSKSLRTGCLRWLMSILAVLRRWCLTARSANVLRTIWEWWKRLASYLDATNKGSLKSETARDEGYPQVSIQTICASDAPVQPSVSFIMESLVTLRDTVLDMSSEAPASEERLNMHHIDPMSAPLPPSLRSDSVSPIPEGEPSHTSSHTSSRPVSIGNPSPVAEGDVRAHVIALYLFNVVS